MMQKQSDGHIFVPDTEIADAEFQCKVTTNDFRFYRGVFFTVLCTSAFAEKGKIKY